MTMPVLSLAAAATTAATGPPEVADATSPVALFAVQPTAVQQYMLDPALCLCRSDPSPAALRPPPSPVGSQGASRCRGPSSPESSRASTTQTCAPHAPTLQILHNLSLAGTRSRPVSLGGHFQPVSSNIARRQQRVALSTAEAGADDRACARTDGALLGTPSSTISWVFECTGKPQAAVLLLTA